jgi:hypothetical protein
VPPGRHCSFRLAAATRRLETRPAGCRIRGRPPRSSCCDLPASSNMARRRLCRVFRPDGAAQFRLLLWDSCRPGAANQTALRPAAWPPMPPRPRLRPHLPQRFAASQNPAALPIGRRSPPVCASICERKCPDGSANGIRTRHAQRWSRETPRSSPVSRKNRPRQGMALPRTRSTPRQAGEPKNKKPGKPCGFRALAILNPSINSPLPSEPAEANRSLTFRA